MKIAIIVNPLIPVPPDKYGGIERIVFMLVQYLVEHGHDVTLYANENSKPGCKLIGYRESESYHLTDFVKINLLTAKILTNGFDLIHTFGRMSNIALAMLSKIPKVVSYQLPPTVSQVQKAHRLARKNSLHFTACSNYIANQIKAYADVTTIYNGIDITKYRFTASVDHEAPLVFLGRIQKEKGTDIAVRLAIQTKRKLVIAGNISDKPLHQQYFTEFIEPFIDGELITYIGPVNDEQKSDLLSKACALLMPVTWDEPFGIVMVEALACGTPVIGFNRGAVAEVVTNGLNGFVCSNFEEIFKAVEQTDKIDRNDCRSVAEKRFSAPIIGSQYELLYQKILS